MNLMPSLEIRAPMACTVVEILVSPGTAVQTGQVLMLLEAMKMEHELRAESAASILEITARTGDPVAQGDVLLRVRGLALHDDRVAGAVPGKGRGDTQEQGTGKMRDDLREVHARQASTLDAQRPEAIAKRHARGQRSARENIADLCDANSFVEYGALALAAQSRRRSHDDLVRNTPADGMVTGIGSVNAARFGPQSSRCAVLAYDATVLAGTQGFRNHQKTDRLLGIAAHESLPVVLFAEGGGGRPGDTDMPIVAGLHVPTFASFARLSGKVPVVGIAAGRCFAGNAALLGCCDVVIATRDSNIGMGGPAMVEGGGLGAFAPERIGPSDVQHRNGVIDVLVDDEGEAVRVARRYLAFFQGHGAAPALAQGAASAAAGGGVASGHAVGAAAADTEMVNLGWSAADQTALREALPENRVRVYDMRRVMRLLADEDSLLELRAGFGVGIFTALARVEGRAIGLMASNPVHLSGAIDADAADKAARFMQLCDAFGLPIVSLVDTPGFMVGPEVETRAQVRHASRMFVVGAQLSVPLLAVVLRKGYGLGAMAMTGGGFHATLAIAAWPSGEFGGMGLEGAVRLGYRKELEAVPAGVQRDALYQELVARQYTAGKAINMAATLEIDAVIDPAATREWLALGLASAPRGAGSRRFIDPW